MNETDTRTSKPNKGKNPISCQFLKAGKRKESSVLKAENYDLKLKIDQTFVCRKL